MAAPPFRNMKKKTKFKENVLPKVKRWALVNIKQISFVIFSLIILSIPFILCCLAEKSDFFNKMLASDTLSYFGVAWGILSSFALYIAQRSHEEERRKYDIRPKIVLSIEVVDKEFEAYVVKITNIGGHDLSEIHFCGDYLDSLLKSKQELRLNLDCKTSDDWFDFECDYKLFHIVGDNGSAPKYLSNNYITKNYMCQGKAEFNWRKCGVNF